MSDLQIIEDMTNITINWKEIVTIQNEFLSLSFTSADTKAVLTRLTDQIDALNAEHAVSILLNTEKGLMPTAGSRIPPKWVELISPTPIKNNVGSCGTAGFLKQRVIAENLLEDRRWEKSQHLQPVHGFMACWSQPLLDSNGELLGTFAVYFKKPCSPAAEELELIEYLGNTVSVVLERKKTEKLMLESYHEKIMANNRLQKMSEERIRLFAIIGHELRTPAAAIKMLLDKDEDSNQLLKETTEHLLNVIDDMRVVSSSGKSFKGELLQTSVYQVISQALQFHDMLLIESGLEIHFSADETSKSQVFVNAQLLRQICLNLLKNAAFHSSADQLWIAVKTDVSDKYKFTISFVDNGNGISKNEQKSLFEPFTRGKTEADGTGLGLHLSRKFARENLGGDLYFSEHESGGAAFTLTMQLEPVKKPKEGKAGNSVKNMLASKKILLAEDNLMIQMMSEELLKDQDADVMSADDGRQAFELAQQHDFDLVITDIFMPEMNGNELTKCLRQTGFAQPIIVISAATIGEDINEALEAGADAAIGKPLDIKALNDILLGLAC